MNTLYYNSKLKWKGKEKAWLVELIQVKRKQDNVDYFFQSLCKDIHALYEYE